MLRFILATAALAAAVGVARAENGPQTVTVLRECPAKGWHRACLPISFVFTDDGSGRLRFKTIAHEDSPYDTKVQDSIIVKGALVESSDRGAFRIKLGDYPVSESEADSPNELGGFAFVGRSRAGRPIVLTDRGPLEILTPGIDFESSVDLYVVRESTNRIAAKLITGYGMPFVVTKAGNVGIWDASRAICIAAPTRTARELQIITTACKKAGIPEEGAVVRGNVTQATDIDEDTAAQIIGEDPPTLNTFRAPGTGLLLIWVNWQYCC